MFNDTYTFEGYQNEKEGFLNSKNPFPQLSLDFCIRFIERLPDNDEIEKHSSYMDGCTGDGDDYLAWGYALHDEWVEDEELGGLVWWWVRFYERGLSKELGQIKSIADIQKLVDTL